MLPNRLLWRLIPTYLILIALFTAVVLGSLSRSLRSVLLEDVQDDALSSARLVASRLAAEGLPPAPDAPVAIASHYGLSSDFRLTVVAADGQVLADSFESASRMDDHSGRPEVREAMSLGLGRSVRFSHTAGRDMAYAAVRANLPDGRSICVRLGAWVEGIDEALAALFLRVGLASVAVALAAAALGWIVSLRVSRQLDGMRRAAESFAAGDFRHRVPRAGFFELDALGRALERMAEQLDERLRTITAQGHEQQAVLSSMSEAVIAVARDGTVLSLNGAAVSLLGAPGRLVERQPLDAVLRDVGIQELRQGVLETGRPAEAETRLHDGSERRLHVRASVLRDASSEIVGVVLVLNDITRLRRLERVRQEFVANVSHELRTPVTSIRGFLETLRDGALDDRERAEQFLAIVSRQAERLHSIIEDLLTLSRLESEGGGIQVVLTRLRSPLEAAVEACRFKANERGVGLVLDCSGELRSEVNAALLEQAVVNLVDNAVKFSDPGDEVRVSAQAAEDELVVSVSDEGPGIPKEHLPRLFERFYRVDRARSRAQGGTGLGLAIVKHIVQAHRGSIEVASKVGEGTTFRLRLPRA